VSRLQSLKALTQAQARLSFSQQAIQHSLLRTKFQSIRILTLMVIGEHVTNQQKRKQEPFHVIERMDQPRNRLCLLNVLEQMQEQLNHCHNHVHQKSIQRQHLHLHLHLHLINLIVALKQNAQMVALSTVISILPKLHTSVMTNALVQLILSGPLQHHHPLKKVKVALSVAFHVALIQLNRLGLQMLNVRNVIVLVGSLV
jgi:hypothetical protein